MKKIYLTLLVALIGVFTLSAQGFNPMTPIPADKDVRIGTLDNGMTYYIKHNAKPEKQANFYIYHDVGAIQEEDSQVGLAHFLEHMAFNGTKNLPGNMLKEYLQTVGVKFGANLNAGTGQDMTFYMMSSVPLIREGVVDTCLMILHDWSYFISLEPEMTEKERGVIVEELRTGNDANFRVREEIGPTLYNNTKYAYRNIIGNEAQLRTFAHQELVDFYHRWYRTDQQAVIVVGDFDVDEMEQKILKVMADIPAVENPEEKVMVQIPDNEEPLVKVATDPELTYSNVMYLIKHQPAPKEVNSTYLKAMLKRFNDAIATMGNYRLKDITQKPNAPFLSANMYAGSYTKTMDVFGVSATTRNGETLQAFEAIQKEIEKIRRYGFTDGEVERLKAEWLRSAEVKYDNRNDRRSDEFIWTYINNFSNNDPMPDAETIWEMEKMMDGVLNAPDINTYLKEYLAPANEVVLVLSPKKEDIAVPTESDIRATMQRVIASEIEAPEGDVERVPLISQELRTGKVMTTEKDQFGATVWTLSNGIKVVVKQTDFKADEVLMNATAKVGLSNIPDQMYASGELLNAFIGSAGVGEFSATDLSKQLAGKEVRLSPKVANYETGLGGNASVKDFETMMQLTYLYFKSPRFVKDDFDMVMDKYKTFLTNVESNPDFIFSRNVTKTMFGDNIRRQEMTLKRLEEVKFEHMETIYKKLFKNVDNFTFTIVGNVDLDVIKPMVEQYLGAIPADDSVLQSKDDGVRRPKGVVENRFEVPMLSPKTSVFYTYSGDIEYTPENILTASVLGEILDIRYTQSIREEKGGTYGVGVRGRTANTPNEEYSLLVVFDTDPKMVDELMEIVGLEIDKLAESGPKSEDLTKVKEFLIKQRPDDLKKNSAWLNYINTFYKSGVDLNKDYDKLLESLDGAKVQAMAERVRTDNNLVKVIMDPAPSKEE